MNFLNVNSYQGLSNLFLYKVTLPKSQSQIYFEGRKAPGADLRIIINLMHSVIPKLEEHLK